MGYEARKDSSCARKRPRWRVTEVWDSQADFERWFEGNVKPAFPEGGALPSITFDELNEVVTA
jgi:heme-degrading monooxygenase HmoA